MCKAFHCVVYSCVYSTFTVAYNFLIWIYPGWTIYFLFHLMFELFSVWEIYGEDIRIQIRTYAQQWAAEIRQGAQMNANSLPKDCKRFCVHLDWGQLPSSYIFYSKSLSIFLWCQCCLWERRWGGWLSYPLLLQWKVCPGQLGKSRWIQLKGRNETAMSVENTKEFNKHLLDLILEVNRIHNMRPPYKYELLFPTLARATQWRN